MGCPSSLGTPSAGPLVGTSVAQLREQQRQLADEAGTWAQRLRTEEDRYWTGIVLPDQVHFPGGEQSTYTSSAIILAADALVGASPASRLFTRPDELPELIEDQTRSDVVEPS